MLAAVLFAMFERLPLMAAAWIVPISLLGNVWTVIWFIVRLPYLRERLTRR